jgi:DNA repair photolyase
VLGAHVDPYQAGGSRLQITRSILQVLKDAGHPVVITTRSALVARDVDLLSALAHDNLVRVFVAIGTLDPEMARCLEPQASAPIARLDAIRDMARAGLHAGVLVTPVIPGLTGTDLESVLEAAAASGAGYADYAMLRLAAGAREPFAGWLQRSCPQRSKVVLGVLDTLMEPAAAPSGTTAPRKDKPDYAEQLARRFDLACRRFLLDRVSSPLCCRGFRVPSTALTPDPSPAGAGEGRS